jgi:3-oxoacyl-[acyl-carrier protein] reductase
MGALDGRVALITGSSRGIGAAIAALFAKEGASVALHGRDERALADVQGAIRRDAPSSRTISTIADVTRFDEIERMRADIERALGPVDVVVANAGGNPVRPGPLEEVAESDWRATVDGNLTATFLTLKSFLPGMKQRTRGSIITLSSAAARRPHAASPIAYGAAKAAIQLLTRDVALQAGPFGIRANCIAPETILTERNAEQIPDHVQATLVEQHAIRRLGTPEDVAHAALYLASESSAWVTGVIMDVAGGSVMA